MDPSHYKDVITRRGLKYHYYYSPARDGKHTLLFCHGFPSSARDWHRVALYFKEQGYGVIIPDMLGYGGTDRPTDPSLYIHSGMSQDIVSILDAEKIEKIIAVGHDWGSASVSRLASWYPERVNAYAFYAVPYSPPLPEDFDYNAVIASQKQQYGYELFGYWAFFNRDEAAQIMLDHIETFVTLAWQDNYQYAIDHFARTGAMERTLLEGGTSPLPSWASEADKQAFIEGFRSGGFAAPTCWYKTIVRGFISADDAQIPAERAYPPAGVPIFYGAATNDFVCLPSIGYAAFRNEHFLKGQVTEKEYDADHWLILSKADEISRDLESWIEKLTN